MSAAGLEMVKSCMMRKEKPALNREKQEYQLFGQLTLKTKKHNSHFKMTKVTQTQINVESSVMVMMIMSFIFKDPT